jgi:hypothetical protein
VNEERFVKLTNQMFEEKGVPSSKTPATEVKFMPEQVLTEKVTRVQGDALPYGASVTRDTENDLQIYVNKDIFREHVTDSKDTISGCERTQTPWT